MNDSESESEADFDPDDEANEGWKLGGSDHSSKGNPGSWYDFVFVCLSHQQYMLHLLFSSMTRRLRRFSVAFERALC